MGSTQSTWGQKTQEAVTKTANLLYNFLDPVTSTGSELVTSSNIRRAILNLATLLHSRTLTKKHTADVMVRSGVGEEKNFPEFLINRTRGFPFPVEDFPVK